MLGSFERYMDVNELAECIDNETVIIDLLQSYVSFCGVVCIAGSSFSC